jgi:hypothetical protein
MALRSVPLDDEALRPSLTVVRGRKPDRRSAVDENHVELLTFFAEVEVAARVIVNAVTGLVVPSAVAINEAHRMAARAIACRAEYLSLTDDGPSAA